MSHYSGAVVAVIQQDRRWRRKKRREGVSNKTLWMRLVLD